MSHYAPFLTLMECGDLEHYLSTHETTPAFREAAIRLLDASWLRWGKPKKRKAWKRRREEYMEAA